MLYKIFWYPFAATLMIGCIKSSSVHRARELDPDPEEKYGSAVPQQANAETGVRLRLAQEVKSAFSDYLKNRENSIGKNEDVQNEKKKELDAIAENAVSLTDEEMAERLEKSDLETFGDIAKKESENIKKIIKENPMTTAGGIIILVISGVTLAKWSQYKSQLNALNIEGDQIEAMNKKYESVVESRIIEAPESIRAPKFYESNLHKFSNSFDSEIKPDRLKTTFERYLNDPDFNFDKELRSIQDQKASRLKSLETRLKSKTNPIREPYTYYHMRYNYEGFFAQEDVLREFKRAKEAGELDGGIDKYLSNKYGQKLDLDFEELSRLKANAPKKYDISSKLFRTKFIGVVGIVGAATAIYYEQSKKREEAKCEEQAEKECVDSGPDLKLAGQIQGPAVELLNRLSTLAGQINRL